MADRKKIIFDTDIGEDCDDVLALDVLLEGHKSGKCELLGVTASRRFVGSVKLISAINTYYGCPAIPIGRIACDGKTDNTSPYAHEVTQSFPAADGISYETTPEAVLLLRRLLSENRHVTIVATGPLTNIAALLLSEADAISPLSGRELLLASVDEIVLMGGCFSHENLCCPLDEHIQPDGTVLPHAEYNIVCDIPAAQTVFAQSPVPLTACPFECGLRVITGKPLCARGGTPDALAYLSYTGGNGRMSWDPLTAYYAVNGVSDVFLRTKGGRITIGDDGVSHFAEKDGGQQRYILCRQTPQDAAKRIDDCVLQLHESCSHSK